MHHVKDNTHKLPKALCTIGGFVVGSSALRVLLGVSAVDTEAKMMLRRSDPSAYETDRSEVTKIDRTANSMATPYDSYDPAHIDLFEWAYTEVHGAVTTSPSTTNDTYEALVSNSTVGRNEENSLVSSQAYSARKSTANRVLTEDGDRLKLFWQEGYYWQENWNETWWCMMCGYKGECKTDEVMRLNNCKNKNERDAKFTVINRKKGDQLQIAGTNFCLEKLKSSRQVVLKTCNETNVFQLFIGFRTDGESFDLRPLKSSTRCLTNHHHPRQGEEVYAESCVTAHRTKTGYWVAY